ncbi:hypothetical protein WCT94_05335 [Pectobacterium sp. 1950-15]|uniref:hypothetical protein n=1 Tax=Pectobacterium sp. 1950-15 TaxID=3128982 RepID=UPI003017A68A
MFMLLIVPESFSGKCRTFFFVIKKAFRVFYPNRRIQFSWTTSQENLEEITGVCECVPRILRLQIEDPERLARGIDAVNRENAESSRD